MESQQLYAQARFNDLKKQDKSDIYTLGAQVFCGEHQKARWLSERLKASSPREQAFINFHMGLSHTRT